MICRCLTTYCIFLLSGLSLLAQQVDVLKIKTSAKENPTATFRCRVPAQYDQSSKVELFSSLVDKCETDSILEEILQATYKLSKTSIEQQRIKELIDILSKSAYSSFTLQGVEK